jgi:pyruvate kinase
VTGQAGAYSQSAEMLKRRRTKIVATLGPASSDPETVRELLAAGVDVVRLNFSHGDHEGHATAYRRVREAAAEADRPVAVLGDLCGPKIRVGRLATGQV